MFKNERISIAVVGMPSSGKSYLLSDIITSFKGLGFTTLEHRSGLYNSFSRYKSKTTNKGRINQTEIYACRPDENIYGATCEGWGKKIDVDFVDIPGEVFNGAISHGNTSLSVFTTFRDALKRSKKKAFTVSVWENIAGKQRLIVEPILKGKRKEEWDKKKEEIKEMNEDDKKQYREARVKKFQNLDMFFSDLKGSGYEESKDLWGRKKIKKISGRDIIKNFFQYQPDSLMYSLAEVVEDFCPGLNMSSSDFKNYQEQFYFLYYCSQATDIILCDKLFVPTDNGGCQLNEQKAQYTQYQNITEQLNDFIRTEKTKVYLAFRGVDFMVKKVKDNYKKLLAKELNNASEDKKRNVVYSIFTYFLWNAIDEKNNAADDDEWKRLVGLDEKAPIDRAKEKYIDLDCVPGTPIHQNVIKPHIRNFRPLLKSSYGDIVEPESDAPMAEYPHIYFTCTPIDINFEVYVNDKESDNLRFRHPDQEIKGAIKYFDTCGSHFCFGTYQLCMDILNQHDKLHDCEYGEIINLSIRR